MGGTLADHKFLALSDEGGYHFGHSVLLSRYNWGEADSPVIHIISQKYRISNCFVKILPFLPSIPIHAEEIFTIPLLSYGDIML